MFEAVTAGGAKVLIVAKYVTSVMQETKHRLLVTLTGGDTLILGTDYDDFVAELKRHLSA